MSKTVKITLLVIVSYLALCAFVYWFNKDNWGDIEAASTGEKLARFFNPFYTLQKQD